MIFVARKANIDNLIRDAKKAEVTSVQDKILAGIKARARK